MAGLCLAGNVWAMTPSALPVTDGFEAYSTGAWTPAAGSYWATEGTGTATIQTNSPASGSRRVTLDNCSLTLNINTNGSDNYTNVWWEFYAMPSFRDDSSGAPAATETTNYHGAFYINTNGALKVLSTNAWLNTGVTGIPTNQWLGFKVNMKYGNSTNYTIWLSTNGQYGSSASFANVGTYYFATNLPNVAELTKVAVMNAGAVDAFNLYLAPLGGAYISMPYFESFESERYAVNASVTNNGVWSISSTGSAQVVSSAYLEGGQGVSLSNTMLTLQVDTSLGEYTNVWVQFYSKVRAYADGSNPDVTGVAAALYLDEDLELFAYADRDPSPSAGDNGWTNIVDGVPTNQWVGFSVHLDYIDKLFDVYTNSGTYGAFFKKVNNSALCMPTNKLYSEFTKFVVLGYGDIDAVAISMGSAGVSNSVSGMLAGSVDALATSAWSIVGGLYPAGQDNLAGTLGRDLANGLAAGDRLRIYATNGWNQYVLSGGQWDLDLTYSSPSDIAPANMQVNPGRGMWIMRSGTNDSVVFYSHATDPAAVTNILYGTNFVGKGWNLCAWPFRSSRPSYSGAAEMWGFSGKSQIGDRLVVYADGIFIPLAWDGQKWRTRRKQPYTINAGGTFWYYRGVNNANMEWVANR